MIKIGTVEIPNKANELTVEQFDKVNHISANRELKRVEKWIEKFIYLGAKEEELEDLELSEFKALIDEFNNIGELPKELTPEIEIEGYTYRAFEGELKLGAVLMSKIEKAWHKNPDEFGSRSLAYLFKRTDLGPVEHNSAAHLEQKMKLFKKQKAELCIPFVTRIIQELTQTAESVINEVEGQEAEIKNLN